MSVGGVFKQFYDRLVITLPMNDVLFIAELYSHDLLPDIIKDRVKTLASSESKASYFLDHVIKPSVTVGVGSSFDELLKVMEDSDYQSVKVLARVIRRSLSKEELADNTELG